MLLVRDIGKGPKSSMSRRGSGLQPLYRQGYTSEEETRETQRTWDVQVDYSALDRTLGRGSVNDDIQEVEQDVG